MMLNSVEQVKLGREGEDALRVRVDAFAFEPLLSAKEAALLLGVHPVTLLRWAREGKVPYKPVGSKIRFRASELNAWCMTLYNDRAVRVAQPRKE